MIEDACTRVIAAHVFTTLRRLVEVKPNEKSYATKFAKDDELKYTVADVTKPKA